MNYVPSPNVPALWEKFTAAQGEATIKRAYMRPRMIPGEQYWEGWDDGQLIGWGVLRRDDAGSYSYRSGIFPAFERQGYRHQFRLFLCATAFENAECREVGYTALLSNPLQVERLMREATTGKWGQFSGMVWYPPPGVAYFHMTREFFETKVKR